MQYLIWSNDEQGWMRPKVNNHSGWTSFKRLAGKFSLEDATKICIEENNGMDFNPSENDPQEIITPSVLMFPELEEEYDDGQGRAYDILDEELE